MAWLDIHGFFKQKLNGLTLLTLQGCLGIPSMALRKFCPSHE